MEHKKTETKKDLEPINYGKELIMIFSNKKSLFSSKKIERSIVFVTFLVITVIYLAKNIHELKALEFVEVTGLWLAYGGYNSIMNYRDKKLEASQITPPSSDNPDA